MAKLRNFAVTAALLAFLGCHDACKNTEPTTSKSGKNTQVSLETRVRTHKLLESFQYAYDTGILYINNNMGDYLSRLESAKSELEKIGDTNSSVYVELLTSIASIYRATALDRLERTLPEVNFSESEEVLAVRIKRKDTKQSRDTIQDRLRRARSLYEKAVRIIKNPQTQLLELDNGAKAAPFYGLGWTCRVLKDYGCSRTAYQEGLSVLSKNSPYKKRFKSALERLAKEEASH